MKRNLWTYGVVAVCVALSAAGCASHGRAAGLGAILGAGAGAVIGNQSGHAGEGALIGAAVGATAGAITHDVKARRSRSREDTIADYDYAPMQGEMLTWEDSSVLPSTVKRGNQAEATIQYALLGVDGGTSVRETRVLKRGSEVVSQFSSKTFTRGEGTWVSTVQFKVPQNIEPGTYTLVQTVATTESTIQSTDTFNVSQ